MHDCNLLLDTTEFTSAMNIDGLVCLLQTPSTWTQFEEQTCKAINGGVPMAEIFYTATHNVQLPPTSNTFHTGGPNHIRLSLMLFFIEVDDNTLFFAPQAIGDKSRRLG